MTADVNDRRNISELYTSAHKTTFDYSNHWQDIEIHLKRPTGVKLGFSIAGGADTFRSTRSRAIVISYINKGGFTDHDQQLKLHDIILRVNNVDFTDIEHRVAIDIFKIRVNDVDLLIRRLSPPILEEIYFSKLPNTHLDLLIAGGINHEYIKGDFGIFITNIIPGGIAHRNGHLKVGDRLMYISSSKNTYDLTYIDRKNAIKSIQRAYNESQNSFTLLVGHARDDSSENVQHDYFKKTVRIAERAIAYDKAQKYGAAAQHYFTAADRLMEAIKRGILNSQMKLVIRSKAISYLRRAEAITKILKNGSAKKKSAAQIISGCGNLTDNKEDHDDYENGAVNRKPRLLKFERAIVTNSKVKFDDVIGLKLAKEALKDAVILPIKFPQFFQGKRKAWPTILLYGPSGAGKSYLMKAMTSECKCTFISVTSSNLLAEWSGEIERNMKDLFAFARQRQPCVVFIDNIDALFGKFHYIESDTLRRVKIEFLRQMQGVETDNSGVFILAATNIPWELDTAIRRGFKKQIHIPLPGVHERAAMFKIQMGTDNYHTIQDHEWMQLAHKTEYFSGLDIAVVCQEALLRPARRLCSATHFKRVENPKPNGPQKLWLVCSPEAPGAKKLTLDQIKSDELCEPPVSMRDMKAAIATQKREHEVSMRRVYVS